MADYDSFRDEWKRTQPDLVVYRPKEFGGSDYENQHLLVNRTPKGDLLALWTAATREGHVDQHICYARSSDQGHTWSEPAVLDGPANNDRQIASWAFPVISATGRIYVFYNKHTDIVDYGRALTGEMRCVYSTDDGRTWKQGGSIPMRRTYMDHRSGGVPCNWIVWQNPIRDAQGRPIVGFTRRSSPTYLADVTRRPTLIGEEWNEWWKYESQCELMRFDNIDQRVTPDKLELSWLPDDMFTLRVAHPGHIAISYAQEPAIALLPDKRLFMVLRTWTGRIYYTVSKNDGHSWSVPDVLRYQDGGAEVLQPKSGCPLYALKDGRYLLFYHNNDGTANGGTGPGDYLRNRWPLYVAVGEFRPNAKQPIWFSQPKVFATTDGVPKPPVDDQGATALTEVGDYTSLTEDEAGRILWYPDRKHFLLGKYVTDEFLADMTVPRV